MPRSRASAMTSPKFSERVGITRTSHHCQTFSSSSPKAEETMRSSGFSRGEHVERVEVFWTEFTEFTEFELSSATAFSRYSTPFSGCRRPRYNKCSSPLSTRSTRPYKPLSSTRLSSLRSLRSLRLPHLRLNLSFPLTPLHHTLLNLLRRIAGDTQFILSSRLRRRVDRRPRVVLTFRVFSVFRGSNLCALRVLCGQATLP